MTWEKTLKDPSNLLPSVTAEEIDRGQTSAFCVASGLRDSPDAQ
jgi:hypothetical protein